MRSKTYYRVRTAVRIIFWTAVAVGFYFIVNNIWWVGDHYCFGSGVKCLGL